MMSRVLNPPHTQNVDAHVIAPDKYDVIMISRWWPARPGPYSEASQQLFRGAWNLRLLRFRAHPIEHRQEL